MDIQKIKLKLKLSWETHKFQRETKGYLLKHERESLEHEAVFWSLDSTFIEYCLKIQIHSEYLHYTVRSQLKFTQCLARINMTVPCSQFQDSGTLSPHPHTQTATVLLLTADPLVLRQKSSEKMGKWVEEDIVV